MSAKKIVQSFLDSQVFVDSSQFPEFFHKDLKVYWHSSSGFNVFDYKSYLDLYKSNTDNYEVMRTDVTHILANNKSEVAARFTLYVRTFENPNEEMPIGYFISIFKVQDDRIIEAHHSSHPSEKES
ncbi:hypothetical protein JCM19294_83 [Nonlabens tegetincola]|uniref:SnoaL-like domain-containing protein n=1 Tax=Nonlabens tegetincola TaxID=323273 RepID=A0A090Q5U0_9FLAO|nr:hypothetical protein [Nonlabens tegetincola]GAK97547.1 hypothetical protein JCM19294_83 [Nonlabens tegetincola]